MCDTFVALPGVTPDASVVFAKNSDREPNEAHHVVVVPAADHAAGATVRATYVEIPQVRHTYAVLLAKPYWIWGAEMGANENGVVIGNEAVFTRVPHARAPALLGMDLLRLGLERGGSAAEALDVMIELLGRHGQGGNNGHTTTFHYHNSFLVADRHEAWVWETAGSEWAARRIPDHGGYASISNAITTGRTWDRASESLVDQAVEQGWCRDASDFHMARSYTDPLYTRFADASRRQCRTAQWLTAHRRRVTPALAMHVLRDHHGADEGPAADRWSPAPGLLGTDVCMHAGAGPVRISQTTGSFVAHLSPQGDTFWVSATAAPCVSLFKPVWFDGGPARQLLEVPMGRYDPALLWWRHEDMHREVLHDYPRRAALVRRERDRLQGALLTAAGRARAGSPGDRGACTQGAFDDADAALAAWTDDVRAQPPSRSLRGFPSSAAYVATWRRWDEEAERPR